MKQRRGFVGRLTRLAIGVAAATPGIPIALTLFRGGWQWPINTDALKTGGVGASLIMNRNFVWLYLASCERTPWVLTPRWSCSSDGRYVSSHELEGSTFSWKRCEQWHYQPDVVGTRVGWRHLAYITERGREDYFSSPNPGVEPPVSVSRCNDWQIYVSFWLFAVLWTPVAGYGLHSVVARPLRKWHRRRRGLCVTCAYDLTGNTSGVCPECGTAIHTLGCPSDISGS